MSPAFFRWKARSQLAYYQSVSFVNGTVTKIDVAGSNTTVGAPFTVQATFPSGEKASVGAKAIVLATGVSDIIPNTPGVIQNWGKGIFWCPVSSPISLIVIRLADTV